MSLRTTVQQGVKAAFDAIGDIAVTVQYYSLTGTMVRDLDAGTSTPGVTQRTLKQVALVRFSQKELDKDKTIQPTSMKALFPAANLPVLAQVEDYFIVPVGSKFSGKWIVRQDLGEPTESLAKLEVRRT